MWFRRRSFGPDYPDTVPKFHMGEATDGRRWTAKCGYIYTFYYDRPVTTETRPALGECCSKCVAATAPAQPFKTGNTGDGQAVVRFPSLEEQRRGKVVIARHLRLVKEDQNV